MPAFAGMTMPSGVGHWWISDKQKTGASGTGCFLYGDGEGGLGRLLQGAQAARADSDTHLHVVNRDSSFLYVWQPPAVSPALGVADVMAVADSLATNLAKRQGVTPFVPLVAALAQHRQALQQEPAWTSTAGLTAAIIPQGPTLSKHDLSYVSWDADAKQGELRQNRG